MALRLDKWVVRGEIINLRRNAVHGWIALNGVEQPMMIDLTGNCDADLAGCHIQFEARAEYADAAEPLPKLGWHQIGPTGTMTAARRVKPERNYEEALAMKDLPSEDCVPSLYLEWFSQNGQVIIELLDPVIEYIERRNFNEPLGKKSRTPLKESADELSIEEPEASDVEELGAYEEFKQPREEDEQSDPFGLLSPDFQRYLDEQSSETDRGALPDPLDEDDDDLLEMRLMDDVLESEDQGEFIGSYLEPPGPLPPPSEVTNEEAEPLLKQLLAHLALYGIALHICEHFTPREAYRVLMEEIAWEGRIHRRLLGTQWVQNYMTHEYCAECEAEADRDFEEMQKKQDGPDHAQE
jgi:hypothetical protein